MILDALKFLTSQAVMASTPKKLETSDVRADRYLIDGGVKLVAKMNPPREHSVKALSEIVELANRFKQPAVVWYDENAVILVIDDNEYRCEKAGLALTLADAFVAVSGLRARPTFDQKKFVKFLRIDLAGTIDPGALLNIVKCVKFETGAVMAGTVERKKESLGKTINSAVSATEGDIPDVVTLSVPVYKTAGLRGCYPIRCTVDVDPAEATFRLIPFPDEIEQAQQAAMVTVSKLLAENLEEGIPFYYGSP